LRREEEKRRDEKRREEDRREENILPLLGVKSRFLGCLVCSLVTTSTMLLWLLNATLAPKHVIITKQIVTNLCIQDRLIWVLARHCTCVYKKYKR
jgi:hypothetical protein